MSQFYTNPAREDPWYSLPDAEVFWLDADEQTDDEGEPLPEGWYWWACFPGCLPDSEPIGPFATEDEALADAQDF